MDGQFKQVYDFHPGDRYSCPVCNCNWSYSNLIMELRLQLQPKPNQVDFLSETNQTVNAQRCSGLRVADAVHWQSTSLFIKG